MHVMSEHKLGVQNSEGHGGLTPDAGRTALKGRGQDSVPTLGNWKEGCDDYMLPGR